MKRTVWLDFLTPLMILFGLTLVFAVTNADLKLEGYFFVEGDAWAYKNAAIWYFLYHYGCIPGLLLTTGSFLVFIGSFWSRKIHIYRKRALFLVLLMLLGPGLVVNATLKDHWGRPRPRELSVFSGQRSFLQAWEKGVAGAGKSFPSGHASAGYFLLAPFFLFRKSSRKWSVVFLIAGLGYGTLMGLGRMAQGAHFATDVVWSGGVVYLCGLLLYYLLQLDRRAEENGTSRAPT